MDKEELDRQTLAQIWQETYTTIKDINGVQVEFRTLYDQEELDCLTKATANEDTNIQAFTLSRWQLAYAINSVDNQPFTGQPSSKYTEILKWPNVIVRACINAFNQVVQEEGMLIENLGNFGKLLENPGSNLEDIGLFPNQLDSEIGQEEQVNSDENS